MVEKKDKREISVKENEIDDALTKLIEFEGEFEYPSHNIKFLCKIIFNLRYDLNELKLELIKALGKGIEVENPEYDELKYPPGHTKPKYPKKSDWNVPKRFSDEIYS